MQSVVHRYYSHHFATKQQISQFTEEEEFCIYRHHNGLCVITIGSEHPIRKYKLNVERVDFDIGGNDRSRTKVKGKKKKGGIQTNHNTVLCKVYTKNTVAAQSENESSTADSSPPLKKQKIADQTEWKMYACVRGFLIEPNLSLVKNPSLLETKVSILHANITIFHLFLEIYFSLTLKDILELLCQHEMP